jgi:SNF2-related domain
MPAKKAPVKKKKATVSLILANDWYMTDQDEILRRIQRAIDEKRLVANLDPEHPVVSNFSVKSPFAERALLADEMGLGKTIQAIAACALLRHLGKAIRVLIVTPASLKAEWKEQIRKFTTITQRIVSGPESTRAGYYADSNPPFFTIVTTSKSSRTASISTPTFAPISSCSMKPNASKTGPRRPHKPSSVSSPAMPSCSPAHPSRTASMNSTPSSISSIHRC